MNFISAFGDEINYLEKYPCADSTGSGLFMGTWGHLSRYLNEHGYRTRAGNDWSPVSLDIILRSVFLSDNEEAEVI